MRQLFVAWQYQMVLPISRDSGFQYRPVSRQGEFCRGLFKLDINTAIRSETLVSIQHSQYMIQHALIKRRVQEHNIKLLIASLQIFQCVHTNYFSSTSIQLLLCFSQLSNTKLAVVYQYSSAGAPGQRFQPQCTATGKQIKTL